MKPISRTNTKPHSDDEAPRTMADSNPWLIEHAKRIAQQASMPSNRPLTASAAIARGMGVPVPSPRRSRAPKKRRAESRARSQARRARRRRALKRGQAKVETPDWAREAAQVAARRAAQKINTSAPHAEAPAASAAPAAQEAPSKACPRTRRRS